MIKTKRVIDLTGHEYHRCIDLTYGDEGYMLEDLHRAILTESLKRHYRYTLAILSTDSLDRIRGWCLLQPVARSSRYMAYFYVEPDSRRQGIGTALIEEAGKWGRYKLDVMSDWTNEGFFDKFPTLQESF